MESTINSHNTPEDLLILKREQNKKNGKCCQHELQCKFLQLPIIRHFSHDNSVIRSLT